LITKSRSGPGLIEIYGEHALRYTLARLDHARATLATEPIERYTFLRLCL